MPSLSSAAPAVPTSSNSVTANAAPTWRVETATTTSAIPRASDLHRRPVTTRFE